MLGIEVSKKRFCTYYTNLVGKWRQRSQHRGKLPIVALLLFRRPLTPGQLFDTPPRLLRTPMPSCGMYLLLFFLLLPALASSREPLIYANPGEIIRLPCPVGQGQRWHRVSWEDAVGRFIATGKSLELRNVNLRHAGRYTCRKLRYGKPGQAPATVVHSVRLVLLPCKSRSGKIAVIFYLFLCFYEQFSNK